MTSTWAVKMDDDLKEKITELIEGSGLSAKNFTAQLVQTYELNKAKEVVPVISQDIDEVQGLTQRMNNILLNIGERIDSISRAEKQEYQEALNQKEGVIIALQEKTSLLKTEKETLGNEFENAKIKINELEKKLVNLESELNKRVNQLTEVNLSNKELLEEYRGKTDTLSGLLNEYKAAKEDHDVLLEANRKAQRSIEKLENDLQAKNIEIQNLKDQLANTSKALEEKLRQLKERAEFEKEKAILELEKKHQLELQRQYEEYTKKTKELLEKMEIKEIMELKEKNTKYDK